MGRMCVLARLHVHARVCVCAVCACVCTHACACVGAHGWVRARVCARACAWMGVCAHVRTCMCVRACAHARACKRSSSAPGLRLPTSNHNLDPTSTNLYSTGSDRPRAHAVLACPCSAVAQDPALCCAEAKPPLLLAAAAGLLLPPPTPLPPPCSTSVWYVFHSPRRDEASPGRAAGAPPNRLENIGSGNWPTLSP